MNSCDYHIFDYTFVLAFNCIYLLLTRHSCLHKVKDQWSNLVWYNSKHYYWLYFYSDVVEREKKRYKLTEWKIDKDNLKQSW